MNMCDHILVSPKYLPSTRGFPGHNGLVGSYSGISASLEGST
ncbi:GSCOCG00005367001-RA-CDS [Cotesia congregata]|nr:GSCOCG00005367001-RA-CDS [Cotesia congregata]